MRGRKGRGCSRRTREFCVAGEDGRTLVTCMKPSLHHQTRFLLAQPMHVRVLFPLCLCSGKIDLDGDKPDAKDMYWKDAGYR